MGEIVSFSRGKHGPVARRAPPRRHRALRAYSRGWLQAARETGPIMLALPLAAFVGVWFVLAPEKPLEPDTERASFAVCGAGHRDTCVIDGDTFRYRGQKIRVADINTPETGDPKCAAEAELGAKATARFTQLLNEGAFTLKPVDRVRDTYGRALFVVTRGGESVGRKLVDEGLAERWQGYRRQWC